MNRSLPIKTKNIKSRRNSRLLAVQCVYTVELVSFTLDQALHDYTIYARNTLNMSFDSRYFSDLVRGVVEYRFGLIESSGKYLASGWRFERLAKLVQAILLVATYEIQYTEDVNNLIIINEYLEISKLFNHEGEVGFINSVLDKVAK